jgi:hypothetical protein
MLKSTLGNMVDDAHLQPPLVRYGSLGPRQGLIGSTVGMAQCGDRSRRATAATTAVSGSR